MCGFSSVLPNQSASDCLSSPAAPVCYCLTVRICSRARFDFLYLFSWSFFSALLCVFCPSPFTTKAEPSALPRGSNLQGAPRAGGLVEFGDAVRATGRNGGQKNRT